MSSSRYRGEPLAPSSEEGGMCTLERAQAIPRNKRLTLPALRSGSAARSRVGSQQPAQEPASQEALREQSNIEQQQQLLRAYTIADVCAMTRLGRTSVYGAIKSGALVVRKWKRRTIVLPEDVDIFLKNLPKAR
jgi:Helix-turn-helix domain